MNKIDEYIKQHGYIETGEHMTDKDFQAGIKKYNYILKENGDGYLVGKNKEDFKKFFTYEEIEKNDAVWLKKFEIEYRFKPLRVIYWFLTAKETRHFNKSQNSNTLSKKFNYIKQHFTYGGCIANNIKIYNLPLTKEQLDYAYTLIADEDSCSDLWEQITTICNDFEENHNNYKIYSEGRMGGYLTLNATRYAPSPDIIDIYMEQSITYKDYVATLHNAYGGSYIDAQRQAKCTINDTFKIITAFDNLCDYILNMFIYMFLKTKDLKSK